MKSPQPSASQLLLLLALMTLCIDAYKPVIIVHGLLDGPKEFKTMVKFIKTAHVGTRVKVIDLYDYLHSLQPMWDQVENIGKEIRKEMDAAPEGINLLCFSQGGLICRAILATTPEHNVHTFIALSSPLAGQFGETEYLTIFLPGLLKDSIYQACYSSFGKTLSICDYWKDPHHIPSYLEYNNFLTYLDGDIRHKDLEAWKWNFLGIKKLILIGGPDDGVITPWQSSQFGFYNSNETVIEMKNRDVYLEDRFGLQTLNRRGDLIPCTMSDVKHIYWHRTPSVFKKCIEEWLI